MEFQKVVYNLIFKKSYVYFMFVLGGAVATEKAIDRSVEYVWDRHNKGKQWKDLEPIYREKGWLLEGKE
jgi:ubiquinol-cytochrome c reductase subunit 9